MSQQHTAHRQPMASRGSAPPPDGRPPRSQGGLARRQVVLILLVNALISAVISVVIALLLRPSAAPETAVAFTESPAQTQQSTPAIADGPSEQVAQTPGSATPELTTPGTPVEPSATPEPVLHTVKAGDTISGLAFKYDVPEEHIIKANELKNPNILQMGTQLIIPVGGLSQATATLTPVPTATDTPIPFEPPSADLTAAVAVETVVTSIAVSTLPASTGELQIEIAEVIRPGEVAMEGVFLINIGGQVADMEGWTLGDEDGNAYTFPAIRLWQGGSLMVYTREGPDDPPSSFFWGRKKGIWSPDEQVILKDKEGNVVATNKVGP